MLSTLFLNIVSTSWIMYLESHLNFKRTLIYKCAHKKMVSPKCSYVTIQTPTTENNWHHLSFYTLFGVFRWRKKKMHSGGHKTTTYFVCVHFFSSFSCNSLSQNRSKIGVLLGDALCICTANTVYKIRELHALYAPKCICLTYQ